jgi:putative redox protein
VPTITLDWVDGLTFIGKTESGHGLLMGGPLPKGEPALGVKPGVLMLIGLAGCMAWDIVSILTKKRLTLTKLSIEATSTHAKDYPKRMEQITVSIDVEGDIPPSALRQAFELSRDKYCSVLATLLAPPSVDFQLALNKAPV